MLSALLALPRAIRRVWRRSLLLRVTATTLVFSIIVTGVLGLVLVSRVTAGLLASKERGSVSEATAGLGEAQRILDAVDTGPSTPSPARLVDGVVSALATRAGSPPTFDVLLLATADSALAPERGTNLVAVSSIPDDLRAAVAESGRQSWTYTEIRYLDGRTAPGLVVGAPLLIPTVGAYELHYLFPLVTEQQTLDLVRSSIVGVGIVLVLLLAAIALLVTRQVVLPVRAAAQTAQRLSSGHLHERLPVRKDDDLSQLARSFNDMAESIDRQITQLEELSRVQRIFVSDVSHELRTPLTTIRMAADVLYEARAQFGSQVARSVELLHAQLDRFEELLADLLEISRFDAGAAVLDVDRVDVSALVQRVIDGAEPLAVRKGVRLWFAADEMPCVIECDPRRIDRIVRNLVDNAIEHADEHGVVIELGANAEAVAISVRDYGVGLLPGEASLVFNRFWRADPARARTTGGTGLGLAIALEDARLHAGWLEAWGEPGNGACFRLTLPRHAGATFTQSPLPLSEDDLLDDDAVGEESTHEGNRRYMVEESRDDLRGTVISMRGES